MPKFSYFQQIVNRAQSASDRSVADLPILQPTRSLFRQWEVHQPLAVDDTASRIEEPSSSLAFESAGPSAQASLTSARAAPSRRPEQPPEPPLAFPAAASLTSPADASTPSGADLLPQGTDESAVPLTPQVPPAISPSSPASAEFLPPSSWPLAAASHSSTSPPLHTTPSDILPPVQLQPSAPLLSEPGGGRSKGVPAEKTPVPLVMQSPLASREASLGRPQANLQQSIDAEALSEQGDRSTLRPPIPSVPQQGHRSQQGTDSIPPPKSATHSLRTTLEPPPNEQRSRGTEILEIPHQQADLGNGPQKRQENTVHIGAIDIRIVPPAVAPPQSTRRVVKTPSSPLSRGFTASFGLRQG